jgi:hypothetical protein
LVNERIDLMGQEGIALDSLPKWLRDQIDYNNESAGRETGRAKRFLTSDRDDDPHSEKQKGERRFSELLRLLQNPGYAKLYSQAANLVSDAQDAAGRALLGLEREGALVSERIKALKDGAAELPDGRKVFRSKDGRLIAEDGKDVTDRKREITGLKEGTPGWEEFRREQDALAEIERRRREIEAYQREVLDPAKTRLGDTDNPPTPDELEEIIRKTRDAMPPSVRSEYEARPSIAKAEAPSLPSAADEYVGEVSLASPPIGSHFAAAITGAEPAAAPQATPSLKRT